MEYLITVIFGLVIGSFLNVCIYRISQNYHQTEDNEKSKQKQKPKEKLSIMYPNRSFCPECKHQLSALDNIPVFSYIFLRGKCRYCKKPISPRYIIVELLTAGIFAFILYRGISQFDNIREITLYVMRSCFFACFLIVITFIDLKEQVIPNKVVYPGIALGLALSAYLTAMGNNHGFMQQEIVKSLIGGIVGAVVILIIAIGGTLIFRKEAMGMGDVRLMAMIGVYLGLFPHIPLTLIIGAISGSIVGIILMAKHGKKMDSMIPFGPFLSLGAIISLLYGKEIWLWYESLMGLR
jgi:leader peptidase (prepilin peptidase)/N-methyltransferase